jgi:hypothetical protein
MSHYSWHTLVKQVEKRRILLIQSGSTFLRVRLPNLLYSLRLLGLVKKLIRVTDSINDPNFLSVVSTTIKPCVLMKAPRGSEDNLFYCKGLIRLAKQKKCILLFYTRNVLDLSLNVTKHMPCFLWNFSRLVNMFEMARHCETVTKFWKQKRGELFVTEGPLFMDTVDNMCVTLDLNATLPESQFGAVVVRMQRNYQLKRVAVVVLQRAVKEWLYRPQTCLGKKIVFRLNCCQK